MPINPVHFAHGVDEEFLRDIFSAFPLADRDLEAQAHKLLDRPSALDIPLVRCPNVSLSDAFARGEPDQALADRSGARVKEGRGSVYTAMAVLPTNSRLAGSRLTNQFQSSLALLSRRAFRP